MRRSGEGGGPAARASGSLFPAMIALAALMASEAGPALAQGQAVAAPPPAVSQPAPVIVPATETQAARAIIRIEALEAQLGALTDRLDRAEARIARLTEENDRLARALDSERALRSAPERTQETAPAPVGAGNGPDAVAQPAQPAQIVPASPPPPPPPPPPASQLLGEAKQQIEAGRYQAAESLLVSLVAAYPGAPETREGHWLLGETRFVQAAYGPAAQAYVAYLQADPQGARAPEALVRLAGAFREIGDARQRCAALAEFRRRAPRPDPTLKARADAETARAACPAS